MINPSAKDSSKNSFDVYKFLLTNVEDNIIKIVKSFNINQALAC
jgi:hypothetical protein